MSDGSLRGRSSPEIDVFETQISAQGTGHVSQSAQYAPFDASYKWDNSTTVFHLSQFTLNRCVFPLPSRLRGN